jgi:hypothetical protein
MMMFYKKMKAVVRRAEANEGHRQQRCPKWVKLRSGVASAECPLYPAERTYKLSTANVRF